MLVVSTTVVGQSVRARSVNPPRCFAVVYGFVRLLAHYHKLAVQLSLYGCP